MFVVLSWLKGPISPTYRDQTQLVGVAFMQLMARVCARPILLLCSALFCPILPYFAQFCPILPKYYIGAQLSSL